MSSRIAEFLTNTHQRALQHTSGPTWLGFFAGLFLVGVGGFLLKLVRRVEFAQS